VSGPRVECRVEGDVGVVRLTRAEKRNAIDAEMADQFIAAAEELTAAGVGVALLEAEPPSFCSGNDIGELGEERDGPASAERVLRALLSTPIFWVAVIEGAAIGAGVSIASACPLTIASPRARFVLSEVEAVGLYPTGVLVHLEKVVGPRTALELALFGEPLEARRALEIGLVNEVEPNAGARARELAVRIAAKPAIADAARRAWQGRWGIGAAREREAELGALLDAQMDAQAVAR
jgi:enoyl-CoA hydratase/carnithine racemase